MSNIKRLIYASDAHQWDHCLRQAWFLFHPLEGPELEDDHFGKLIRALGEEHEAAILRTFVNPVTAESAAHTQALMKDLAPVIYQPRFIDESLGLAGNPDFLILSEDGYQVADAKLAMSVDKNRAIKTQLGVYQLLSKSPLAPIVFLGDGEACEVGEDISSLAQRFLADMQTVSMQDELPDTHFGFSKCQGCTFYDVCLPTFEQQDDLTLSPAIDARTAEQLKRQGFTTLADVAGASVVDIAEAPYLRSADKRQRVISQAKSLKTGKPIRRVVSEWPTGTMVHFDVESDPMAADGAGEVYLWGLLGPSYDAENYDAVWRETDDLATWQAFLGTAAKYKARYPDLLLVHYSHYERVQIEHYAERYSAIDDPIVQWLLAEDGPLWDLQKFLKLNYILPVRSYGLKAICKDPRLANFQWRVEESGSQWSVVRYYDYVEALAQGKITEAETIRTEILLYNEDDVRATAAVVAWLRNLNQQD